MVNLSSRISRSTNRDDLAARLARINGIRNVTHPRRVTSLHNLARSVLPVEQEVDNRQGAFDFDLPAA